MTVTFCCLHLFVIQIILQESELGSLFVEAGIPKEHSLQYANLFVTHKVDKSLYAQLCVTDLKEMGITIHGDCMKILKALKRQQMSGMILKLLQKIIEFIK